MAAVSYDYYITRFLGNGWTDLNQTSHMNRTSLRGVHLTFEIFKMAAISKWLPFLDFSEITCAISIKLFIDC